jgi:hypothetical protein
MVNAQKRQICKNKADGGGGELWEVQFFADHINRSPDKSSVHVSAGISIAPASKQLWALKLPSSSETG